MCYISLQPKIIGNKTSKFLINISINGQRKNYVVISDTPRVSKELDSVNF